MNYKQHMFWKKHNTCFVRKKLHMFFSRITQHMFFIRKTQHIFMKYNTTCFGKNTTHVL
jgi:hypothetical protein